MTRISACVKPRELCDKMLLAEHREIVRIPNCIVSGKAKVKLDEIPPTFRLGKGHVKFFYNKIGYLHERYNQLRLECLRRGFNVSNYGSCFTKVPDHLYKEWTPNEITVRPILVERINERLSSMKNIKFWRENVNYETIKLC